MSVKQMLNIEPEEMGFDVQIGTYINAQFMTLHQLGIGPDEGFSVWDADTVWTDFSTDKTLLEVVKQYVCLKVRMMFDPPASSIVSDAINNQIHELEWRLNIQAEKAWEEYPQDKNEEETNSSEDDLVSEEAGEP
jgi:hypothetical protein